MSRRGVASGVSEPLGSSKLFSDVCRDYHK